MTRNIIIDTFEDAGRDPLVGGHVMVYRTQIPQYIVGVEFQGLGQQGTLGRYPVHFHMCGRSAPACLRCPRSIRFISLLFTLIPCPAILRPQVWQVRPCLQCPRFIHF